jgi:uncharacterized membrane protein YphA (DoxX/SURF4 family)
MSKIRSDQAILAIASASLALLSLAYGDFAPGGENLPDWLPYREIFTRGLSLILLAASVGLWWWRTATLSLLVIGGYDVIWMLISVPLVLSHPASIGTWYPLCEALTALVAPCVLYIMLRSNWDSQRLPTPEKYILRAAQIAFGLTCIFYGSSHFAYADYTASMVPTWLPGPLEIAYLTGLGHIAAGLGIIAGILPRLAALLETMMMTLFGLLVWAPTFFMPSPPKWATPPYNQWSEVIVNLMLVASAWMIATSLKDRIGRTGATLSK